MGMPAYVSSSSSNNSGSIALTIALLLQAQFSLLLLLLVLLLLLLLLLLQEGDYGEKLAELLRQADAYSAQITGGTAPPPVLKKVKINTNPTPASTRLE